MILGIFCPEAARFPFLIPWIILGMLWLAFLDIRPGGLLRKVTKASSLCHYGFTLADTKSARTVRRS